MLLKQKLRIESELYNGAVESRVDNEESLLETDLFIDLIKKKINGCLNLNKDLISNYKKTIIQMTNHAKSTHDFDKTIEVRLLFLIEVWKK